MRNPQIKNQYDPHGGVPPPDDRRAADSAQQSGAVAAAPEAESATISLRCLSLDLEVGKEDGRIHAFGAVRADTGRRLVHSGGGLPGALAKLDELADGASFVLGHNLIAFDLPHLAAANPGLRLLKLPAVDTLMLSPLAFPRNPYHHLVKHYQDGGLKRGRVNDPELDARLALEVFGDELKALREADSGLLAAWHWLTTPEPEAANRALDDIFSRLRRSRRPSDAEASSAIRGRLEGAACTTHAREAVGEAANSGWALAYALAWLSVAGGNSVMPPWVRYQFPEAGRLVRRLRDNACADPSCGWCRDRHDARKELTRWFGFADFRPEPAGDDGHPMQKAIVEAAMAGEHVLGILPTGAGKSLGSIRELYASSCYGGGETGPVIGAGGEADEVEPAQVVVQIAGGDAAAGTQEVLQPAGGCSPSAHADRPEPVPPSSG